MSNSNTTIEQQIGMRIAALRRKAGLRQKELAGQLNVTVSTISHYESGTNVPSVSMLISIAAFFGVSVDYLLGQTQLKMDWQTFHRNINLLDGTSVSLESVINTFLKLSEQNQADVYRLINLFLLEDQLRHNSIMRDDEQEFDRVKVDKMINTWLELD